LTTGLFKVLSGFAATGAESTARLALIAREPWVTEVCGRVARGVLAGAVVSRRSRRSSRAVRQLSCMVKTAERTASPMTTIILLIISNIFMTLAWYGHLKLKAKPLLLMILMSWLIALPEYLFQVPANRIGSATFTVTQLKIIQECITLVVFTVIAFLLFGERPSWNIFVSYLFIVGAVYCIFRR
jgi:uncharacterized protein (DUF486 family)